MSLSEELAYMPAAELASRIRRRELSPVDVVEASIGRIEQRDKSLNAFVYRGFEDARKNAKEAERALMSGEELGILHGVPTAMKDLFDFRPGWVATFGGVKAFQNNVSDFYSNYPERIEKAGAILLGKTNSPVMGFRGTCDNYLFGPTRNPFDLSRNSGGSSGGSAAAVADGMVPIAQGSDGGGSVRIPAAWCGLYGFKASFGRVPMVLRPNAFGGTAPFVFEGTLTRTVEDAALGLTAITGYNSRDPYSLDQAIDYMGALRGSVKGWKIAYSPDLDVYPVDKRVAETVANAVKMFEAAGARVEEVKLGLTRDQRELSDLWCRMIMPLSIETFENFKRQGLDLLADHREDFPPQFLEWLEKCSHLTIHDLIRDQQIRTEVYDAIQNVLDDYQLLITPTLAALPVENADDGNTTGPTQINGVEVDPLIGWCMTYFINFTGHPAASIPAGLADGLPVGMQIIGRRYADTDVLTASSVFERIKPWQDIYKLCAARPL
ncbi:amidase [Brevibacillus massiliensis]|jgi:amidase/aspartyl-tRNA(Asn)/glutamyl-tRNA(Gln) amidotransferase subunit A|uniref:amidase n=1 Tax=Brevibacillus massiliensis TaxID=1118054 RepID=UPI00030E6FE0|nr:amidase [Brevibacillus massiliensis]